MVSTGYCCCILIDSSPRLRLEFDSLSSQYTTDPNHPSIAAQKKKSSRDNGEELINMQQQYPVETILHSKFESNGQQKYLIRWMGDHKDSWQPKGNITSDVIEDFNKRKIQERANEHLAKVSVYSIQGILFAMSVLPSCVTHIAFISSL